MSGRLEGQVALVTGGASGIGKAISERFVAEGAQVLVTDVDESAGARVAETLGDAARFRPLDVAAAAHWDAAFAALEAAFGPPTVLVNNAGVSRAGSIASTSEAEWRRTLDVNATGAFLGARRFLTAVGTRRGSILNIASARGLRPSAGQVAYSASKALLIALTKSVALHCGETGLAVRCNSLCPGVIDTPILDETRRLLGEGADARLAALHPMGRLGTSEEVAAAAAFLASDEAAFITGAVLSVDGGFAIRDR